MKRKKISAEFKTKIVIEALRERETVKDLGLKHKIHPQQISNWKRIFLASAVSIFATKQKSQKSKEEEERDQLLRTIGELKIENDYLKKMLH